MATLGGPALSCRASEGGMAATRCANLSVPMGGSVLEGEEDGRKGNEYDTLAHLNGKGQLSKARLGKVSLRTKHPPHFSRSQI